MKGGNVLSRTAVYQRRTSVLFVTLTETPLSLVSSSRKLSLDHTDARWFMNTYFSDRRHLIIWRPPLNYMAAAI